MCGIGVYASGGRTTSPVARTPLQDVADALSSRGPDNTGTISFNAADWKLQFLSTVLHMRGESLQRQPIAHENGDVFAWNGEVFGGLPISSTASDTTAVAGVLQRALPDSDTAGDFVTAAAMALSSIDGPFAFVYWHARSCTLLYGRDRVGRRSLILMSPEALPDATESNGFNGHSEVLLTSVGPVAHSQLDKWHVAEVAPSGVHGLVFRGPKAVHVHAPWPAAVPRFSIPTALSGPFELPAGAGMGMPVVDDACMAAASLELLRRLSASVRDRVTAVTRTRARPAAAHERALPADDGGAGAQATLDMAPFVFDYHSAPATVTQALAACASRRQASGSDRLSGTGAGVRQRHVDDATTVSTAVGTPSLTLQLGLPGNAADAVARFLGEAGQLASPGPAPAVEHGLYMAPGDSSGTGGAHAPITVPTDGDARQVSSGATIAILFSGGLDSMVLARLAHEHTPADEPIDLINVCFAADHRSPDRLAAWAGLVALRSACPGRVWQLICVDDSLEDAMGGPTLAQVPVGGPTPAPVSEAKDGLDNSIGTTPVVTKAKDESTTAPVGRCERLLRLLRPAGTVMDFNIGSALWAASQGVGYVDVVVEPSSSTDTTGAGGASGNGRLRIRYADIAVWSDQSGQGKPAKPAASRAAADAETAVSTPSGPTGRDPLLRYGAARPGTLSTQHRLSDFQRAGGGANDTAGPFDGILAAAGFGAIAQALRCESPASGHADAADAAGHDSDGAGDGRIDADCAHGPAATARPAAPPPLPAELVEGIQRHVTQVQAANSAAESSPAAAADRGAGEGPTVATPSTVDALDAADESSSAVSPSPSAPAQKGGKGNTGGGGGRPPRSCPAVVKGRPCLAVPASKCVRGMCKFCCLKAQKGQNERLISGEPVDSTTPCPLHKVLENKPGVADGTGQGTVDQGTEAESPVAASTDGPAGAGPAHDGTGGTDGRKGLAVPCTSPRRLRVLIRSSARVLLLGIGADEQMGGYGRHRTAYREGGWTRLQSELQLDVARLWRRNLGRDDRVCSDSGREVRLPFLEEGVSAYLRFLPVPVPADLRLPHGVGDKRILRAVGAMLGLHGASALVKRAIHFGSRIAKAANTATFGSNRKANLAHGGSAEMPPMLQVHMQALGRATGATAGEGKDEDDE